MTTSPSVGMRPFGPRYGTATATRGASRARTLASTALCGLLLSACAGGLSASGGLKLDAKAGMSSSLSTKLSTKTELKAGETAPPTPEFSAALDAVLASPKRSEENRLRDKYQHPKETLEFFGLRQDMAVLEVEPGADGWYTEIFAPLLKEHGKYITTNFDPNGPAKSPLTGAAKDFQAKLDANPELFGKVEVVTLTKDYKLGEADSLDMIVTFRNSHLWKLDKLEDRVYGEMFRVLKPGAVLGLVQHRAAAGDNPSRTVSKGYLPQPYVIERIEKAGFVFEAESHVNTNSWDTRDYPKGVWTLPPSLALGDKDREKYLKIGESDRMTLRFRKPLASETHADPDKGADAAEGKPDAAKPDGAKPDTAKPEAGKPEAVKADGSKAEGAKPEAAKPDAPKPDGKPEAAKADGAKADGAKADATKPEAAKPNTKAEGSTAKTGQPGSASPAPGVHTDPATPAASAKAAPAAAPKPAAPAGDKKAPSENKAKAPEGTPAEAPAAPKVPQVRPVPASPQ